MLVFVIIVSYVIYSVARFSLQASKCDHDYSYNYQVLLTCGKHGRSAVLYLLCFTVIPYMIGSLLSAMARLFKTLT